MGKKNGAKVQPKNETPSAPVLTVVSKPSKEPRYVIFTVKVRADIPNAENLVFGGLEGTASGYGVKLVRKVAKNGRVTFTFGAVAAGRAKLTDAQKAERKAERAKINATTKNLRKQMRTNPIIAAFAAKVANGEKLNADETAKLIALVS